MARLCPLAREPAEPSKAGSPAMQKLRAEYLAAQKLQAELKLDKPLNEWTLEEQAALRANGDAKRAAEFALHRQTDIEQNLVITNLFLTPSLDEDGEPDYTESLEEHESEIIALAIADFNSCFTVPQRPDPDECFIEEQTVNLHYNRHRWSIASYDCEINTTDFPGRVELTFNEPND
jgi:hypothetical protein